MPAVTLAQLRARARQHANQEDSLFVSDAELTGFLNRSLDALYDKVVGVWRDYFLRRTPATFTGASFTLAADFYKLVAVRVRGSAGRWVRMRVCGPDDEDSLLNATTVRPEDVRYRLEGKNILTFFPGFGAGQVPAQVVDIPLRPQLVLDADTTEWPASWEEWAVLDTAIKCVTKAEQDTAGLEKLLAKEEARIVALAPQRDENDVARVQDVTTAECLLPGFIYPPR